VALVNPLERLFSAADIVCIHLDGLEHSAEGFSVERLVVHDQDPLVAGYGGARGGHGGILGYKRFWCRLRSNPNVTEVKKKRETKVLIKEGRFAAIGDNQPRTSD
jgi:hypothetical protein